MNAIAQLKYAIKVLTGNCRKADAEPLKQVVPEDENFEATISPDDTRTTSIDDGIEIEIG